MKAALVPLPQPEFPLVNIILTFESEEELAAFYDVTNWAHQAAKAVAKCTHRGSSQNAINVTLQKIWMAVDKVGGWSQVSNRPVF